MHNDSGQADLIDHADVFPYKIIKLGNFNIGLVAITTPDTLACESPKLFMDEKGDTIYSFSENEDGSTLYKCIQENVDKVKNEGADYVILVGHLGEEGDKRWLGETVASNISGIDALIDGHSHQVIDTKVKNKDGKDIPLVQTGTKLTHIGTLTIDKNGDFTNELIDKVTDENGNDLKDEKIVKVINDELEDIKPMLMQVVSHTKYLLTVNDENGNRHIRSGETNLGDVCTDALRSAMRSDITLLNGGGIRDNIPAGDITYNSILKVFPFGNLCSVIKVKGQVIKDALEFGAMKYPEENGGFLQVSGFTYTIDSTMNSTVKADSDGNFISVDGDYRVKDIKIGEEDIDLNRDYTIGTIDFLVRSLGNGYTMFKGAEVVNAGAVIDSDALAEYFKTFDNEKYKDIGGDGRILINDKKF